MREAEFSRPVKVRPLPGELRFAAEPEERAALAGRFGLLALDTLEVAAQLEQRPAAIRVRGTIRARLVQPCAVSGEALPQAIEEELALHFVPATPPPPDGDEIELEAHELDEIAYEGDTFDLGEAAAQTLALAIDPYACGPEAQQVRAAHGLDRDERESPFAALAALRK